MSRGVDRRLARHPVWEEGRHSACSADFPRRPLQDLKAFVFSLVSSHFKIQPIQR